jgi:hypothetical protein
VRIKRKPISSQSLKGTGESNAWSIGEIQRRGGKAHIFIMVS